MSYENKSQKQKIPPMMRGAFGGKAKNFKSAWGNLLSYTKPFYPGLIVAIIFAIITTSITLIGPSLIERITNLISEGLFGEIKLRKITNITIILASLYLISSIISYLSSFIMATITRKLSKILRKDISRKINVVPLGYLDRNNHGEVLSRITNDVDTISHSLDSSIVTVISSTIMLLGSLIIMFIKSWILTLTAISASLFGLLFSVLIVKFSRKHFVNQQQALGKLNGHIEESYSGHVIIKAYNAEENYINTFKQTNNDLYQSAWKSQFFGSLMMPIMSFIGNLGFVIVCVVGGMLHLKGHIEIGTISAFMLYIRYFTQPLTQLAQMTTNIQSAAAASERVFEMLNQKELEDESHKTAEIKNCKGKVEFKNVKFGYDSEKIIIKDFSANIKPGQKVAIVGHTGAGKTTLVNLIMRFYELNSGEILIDDTNIKDISRENLHNQFSMVLQDSWIFNGTIKENIKYSKEDVTDEQVIEACKAVNLHHFIKTLPNGYNTILDENTTISLGQKQLLTIARAMVQNNPMLILDEATSSVDTRLEILIQEAMDKLMTNKTSFVIAHRLSTIKNADVILVMQDGDVIESGSHDNLLALNGAYAELYNSQFEEA